MRRFLLVLVVGALVTGSVATTGEAAAGGKHASHSVTLKVKLIQEATYRTVKPPDGNAGDIFSNKLRMFADGTTLGFADGTPVGSISYSWWFTGAFSCDSAAAGCKGTTNVRTITRLPGGTITAGADRVVLGVHGEVVPIQSGTGTFKGVTGNVTIAPGGIAEAVFTLVLPTS